MSQAFEIESENHFNEELRKSQKYLICFFATWCPPCQRFSPVFKKVSEMPEFENIPFIRVNIDSFPDLAARYKVSSVPSTILVANGKEQSTIYGYKNEEETLEILTNFFS